MTLCPQPLSSVHQPGAFPSVDDLRIMMDSPKAPPKYTTVGSIVNPKSTPLQPPARRGRTAKWPLPTDIGLITSQISGLGFSLGSDSRALHTDNQPLHYSPLQQNTDRAVSPTNEHCGLTIPNMSFTTMLAACGDECDEENTSYRPDDVEDDNFGDHDALKAMSVKTLTNLASYENPKQKVAQRILSRARAAPLHKPRAQPDKGSVADLMQSDGAIDRDANTATYSSVLSKRPGAPQPLMAGPPGLRQHRSSTLDHTVAGKQALSITNEISTTQQDASIASYMKVYPSTPQEATPMKILPMTSIQKAFRIDGRSASRMIDTLPPEQAREYYDRELLPANFNYQTQAVTITGEHGMPLDLCEDDFVYQEKRLLARRVKINALWSEGTAMLHKSMEQAIIERNHRDFEEVMGYREHHGTISQENNDRPKLSIQCANHMSAKEHAAPLLSMAFQTLINLETFTLSGNLPKLEYREI